METITISQWKNTKKNKITRRINNKYLFNQLLITPVNKKLQDGYYKNLYLAPRFSVTLCWRVVDVLEESDGLLITFLRSGERPFLLSSRSLERPLLTSSGDRPLLPSSRSGDLPLLPSSLSSDRPLLPSSRSSDRPLRPSSRSCDLPNLVSSRSCDRPLLSSRSGDLPLLS